MLFSELDMSIEVEFVLCVLLSLLHVVSCVTGVSLDLQSI